ncbi:hypothetical protein E5F05_00545 (plasmid) [Deinococcus metallilatus]|uniref:Uncharacterized protein n=1 Tax=Deinococcus metallilatus TaxID=1211322 RepID=A0AAJ5F7S8_9DEIO|nr:hypothetical protein [Deinococcus metallilatus]MBB5293390.1 hypothetical protein [Deinococcus metallilatus]QBY06486.1 hypothetical protein E5F05_00545 [Deinococcus metallilatus]RXJ17829.1 hypothetical protein ERJ73_00155 [Deinococcus metallilatus]TLK32101.1 hypothetical protein FCS05_01175 [Deinococcus metallilatus]GMA15389.1 hypothetical protein GCM10025871_17200 [Deinococcus metallilatus]
MTETSTDHAATDPQYKKLSEIAQQYQPEDLLLILDPFGEGLSSAVQALPLADKFDVRVMEQDGQIKKRQMPDELVRLTPEGEAWFDHKAQETRQVHLEERGNIAVNAERILSGQDDFAALFEARRKFIVQKLKDEKKGKAATSTTTGKKASGKTATDKATRASQTKPTQNGGAPASAPSASPTTPEA